MKILTYRRRILHPGRTFSLSIASAFLLLALASWVGYQSRPSRMLVKKQEALIEGIEKRSASRVGRLVSEGYADRWGFDRNDAVEAVLDVGSQFLTLVVKSSEQVVRVEGEAGVIRVELELSGKPLGPVGMEATRRLNQLESPFEFTWRRESILPTSWKLVTIENRDLPDDLYGYEPGDIRRAMNSGLE